MIPQPPLNATRELAEFVVRTRIEDLPSDLLPHVRRSTLDCLGVAIGGVEHPSVPIMLDTLDLLGGNPQATVWATSRRTNVALAALANGHLAHVLDFDDSYVPEITILHGNAPVVPAALGVGELCNATGADYVLAFALGFEVAARIALSGGRAHYESDFHVTSTVGAFGAAAAAGKLLGLDAHQIAYAMGVAGAQAGGTEQALGTMTKPFHAGRASMSGTLAALLASRGFTSAEDVLYGKHGFNEAYPSDRDVEALLADLGRRWELRQAAFKPYACGVVQHPLMDAAMELREELGLRADDVEAVEARVNPAVLRVTGKTDPRTDLESKFSVYHSVAVAIMDGEAGPRQYTTERARDEAVRSLRSRIRATEDAAVHKDEAHMTLRLRDGRVFERHIPHATGTAANPMNDAQMERKFRLLVEPILGAERADTISGVVGRLPEVQSVSELTSLLAV